MTSTCNISLYFVCNSYLSRNFDHNLNKGGLSMISFVIFMTSHWTIVQSIKSELHILYENYQLAADYQAI